MSCLRITDLWQLVLKGYKCVETALVSKQMVLVTHTRACLRCVYEKAVSYCVCVNLFDVVEVCVCLCACTEQQTQEVRRQNDRQMDRQVQDPAPLQGH